MSQYYIHATDESGKHFFSRNHFSPVVMLNLLRFKEQADYSGAPHLLPNVPITGKAAYDLYIQSVRPMLDKIGSQIIFYGTADRYLIGPFEEKWDLALLVKHLNMKDFMAFASDKAYLNIEGHRTAALEDSRLLPLLEEPLL